MDRIRIARPGLGRPQARPDRVVADKGYSAHKIRAYLRRRGIACTNPERVDQINGRIRRGEILCRLDKAAYRRRNVVERCFSRPSSTCARTAAAARSLIVTSGQRAECAQFVPVLEKIRVPRLGPGRPRKTPDSLAASRRDSL